MDSGQLNPSLLSDVSNIDNEITGLRTRAADMVEMEQLINRDIVAMLPVDLGDDAVNREALHRIAVFSRKLAGRPLALFN